MLRVQRDHGKLEHYMVPTYRLVAGPVRALSAASIGDPLSCESPAIVPGDHKYMLLEGKLDFEVMPDTRPSGAIRSASPVRPAQLAAPFVSSQQSYVDFWHF
jgi:hypothetical protein